LSALDAYIKEQAEANKPIQPDEFTIYDYIDKMKEQGVRITYTVSGRNMKSLIEAGVITTRKAIKDGKQCNFYRFI
jgi:predicted peroxiredoxin